jgi:hypothetical protein
MINNQSEQPEELLPKDSKEKKIQHKKNDEEAVVKAEDLAYNQEDANFGNIASKKESGEQPVLPVKNAPKED